MNKKTEKIAIRMGRNQIQAFDEYARKLAIKTGRPISVSTLVRILAAKAIGIEMLDTNPKDRRVLMALDKAERESAE